MQLGTADLTLTVAAQTVLAPGSSAQWLITKATITNLDTVQRTVTVYRVPSGGTAGSTNIIVNALPIQAGETEALPLSAQPLLGGQTLQATTDLDNMVNINVGYEIVT